MSNPLEALEAAERKIAQERRAEDARKLERLEWAAWKFYETRGTKYPHAKLLHDAASAALRWHKHQDAQGPGMTAPWVEGYLAATIKSVETLVADSGVRDACLGLLANAQLIIMDSYVGMERVEEAERRFIAISMRGSVDR